MSSEISLIQSSFLKIIPQRQRFASLFYETLFHDHPEFKPLFTGTNIQMQESKIFTLLSMAVNNLNNPEKLRSKLHELGRHLFGYRVKPEYYPLVGEALFKALAIVIGEGWTPALQHAWAEGYQAIADLMLEGYPLTAEPAPAS